MQKQLHIIRELLQKEKNSVYLCKNA